MPRNRTPPATRVGVSTQVHGGSIAIPMPPCSFRNESDRINLFFIERYCAKDAVLTSPLGCGGARFHGPGKREKK